MTEKREDKMINENERRQKRTLTGVVLSDKMNKTVVVQVTRLVPHPLYKKYIKKHKKYKAHDEKEQAKPGDKVCIEQTRPISKSKRWKVVEVTKS